MNFLEGSLLVGQLRNSTTLFGAQAYVWMWGTGASTVLTLT